MKVILLSVLLAILHLTSGVRFVTYVGQAGPGWGNPGTNEDFLKYIGVPGYGEGSMGYNVINLAFWVSNSNNGGAAVNGAAYDWQNILNRITSTSLRQTLTGSTNPSADQLRSGIKAIYAANSIKLCISAFGGADHPMGNGKAAVATAIALAAYAKLYRFDCVDVDWEEAYYGKFASGAGGEAWLCSLTNRLRSELNSDQLISHAPQAPYFSNPAGYPGGGYVTVNRNCGGNIDFYNVQFYNQGTTSYADYNGLFVSSIGWCPNSAVYQIINKGVPASKIIVGKHTSGDGSTFVSGANLKSIFQAATNAGTWNAGFMTWQFYREVAYGSTALVASVKTVSGWGATIPTTPTAPTATTTTTLTPTIATTASSSGNIMVTVRSSGEAWFFAASIAGATPGYTVTLFQIYNNGAWHTCTYYVAGPWYKCETLGAQMSTPVGIKITAGSTSLTAYVVTSLTGGGVFDFGTNFETTPAAAPVTAPTPTRRPTERPLTLTSRPVTAPTPPPVTAPTLPPVSTGGGGGRIRVATESNSNRWWCVISLSGIPSGVSISRLEMKAANSLTYETGSYATWGRYYTFNSNAPYSGALSFRITSTSGQTVVSNNVVPSADPNQAGTMSTAMSASYNAVDNDNDNDTLSWTVWFAIFVSIIIVIAIGIAIYVYYKRSHRGKAYMTDSKLSTEDAMNTPPKMDTLNEEEVEMDIEVEMEGQNITATAD